MGEKHIGHLLPRLTFSLVAVFMHVKLVLTFKNYNYERNEQFHNLWFRSKITQKYITLRNQASHASESHIEPQ